MTMFTLVATAQEPNAISPYSRYGLGMLADQSLGFNKGMEGTALGMSAGDQLNVQNPASYARLDSLSFLFDIGASLQNANFRSSGTNVNRRTGQFDYLSMGFRLAPNVGFSLGLLPFSFVGYDITSKGTPINNGISGTVTPSMRYKGSGGLQEIYAGIGYSPLRSLALGMNVGYLWGTFNHSALTSYSDATVQTLNRTYETEVRSYKIDFGVQYTHVIDRNSTLSLGLIYGLGHNLYGASHLYNSRYSSGVTTVADTLTVHNAFQLPHSFGGGLVWQWKNRLRVGIDFIRQNWSKTTAPVLVDQGSSPSYIIAKGQYDDMSRISIGAEYVDNPVGFTWKSRVRYRLGMSYTSPYAKIDGQHGPRTYTAGIGVGIPILTAHHNRNFLNLSAQYVHVKPQIAGQITENYLRFTVGLTFNDRWFQKWKVN